MEQIGFFDLLAAPGPFAEYADKLMLFGQFVGSWDLDGTWYERDGSSKKGGKWHLSGYQSRDSRRVIRLRRPHQRGSTLRCYDVARDAWNIAWMQPASGEFVHMTGRKVGDRIVLEGVDFGKGPLRRWSFTDITPNSFTWLGEVLKKMA
jgi:hypothetical protein